MTNKKKGLIFICLLLILEGTIRAIDDPYDINFMFGWEFWDTRLRMSWIASTQPEDSQIPLNSEGYRGVWEKERKTREDVRILFLGAGHGFADNIDFGQAWGELVEESLSKKLRKNVALWNFSVNGSTIIFAERCLIAEVIAYEPDVVIFSHSGYNEAIRSDVSDSFVVYDGMHLMNFVFSSALVRSSFVWGIQSWKRIKGEKRKPKVDVDEFVASYERMISLLQENGIPMILLQQEVITPDIPPFWYLSDLEPYRKKFHELSQKHGLVYVDPKNLIHGKKERYFDNGEYYSALMHTSIAKELEPYLMLLVQP